MLVDLKVFENMPYVEHPFKGGYICGLNTADRTLAQAIGRGGNYEYEKSYFQVGNVKQIGIVGGFMSEWGDLNSYGVVDTPEQFRQKFGELLEADERQFAVFFTPIGKDPENRGHGGGWRWHKWGPYYGDGKPECEHLDDEDGFDDGIYVFHIYVVDGVDDGYACYFDLDLDGYTSRVPAKSLDEANKEIARLSERAKELNYKAVFSEIVMVNRGEG